MNGLPHIAWGYYELKWMQLKKFKFKAFWYSCIASSSFILSQCNLKWSLIVHLVFCMKCDLAHGLVFYSLISMVNILPIIKHEVLNLWRWCWIDQVLLHFQVNLHLARVPGNKNIHSLFSLMAPYFLALVTTLENLGAGQLLTKKVNFVPWTRKKISLDWIIICFATCDLLLQERL